MGDLWFQLLADNDADRARLNAEITAKMTAEDIVGYETMLKVDAERRRAARRRGAAVSGMGLAANAVRHFQASAALKPESAAGAFQSRHRAGAGRAVRDAAISHYERALAQQPGLRARARQPGPRAAAEGRGREALKHLQEAVRLDPGNIEALNSLSVAYAAEGDTDEGDRDHRSRAEAAPSPQIQKTAARTPGAAPPQEDADHSMTRSEDQIIRSQRSSDRDHQLTTSPDHQITALYRADPCCRDDLLDHGSSSAFVG